ncbi:MAG: hypothetical protein H0W41_07515, partial [Chloroflexi bacterium]|nr:hypothetical protein [Chloroflexota bacterium]
SAPLGGLFAGFVAETWGTPAAFVTGAVLSLVTVGVVALGLRWAGRRGSLGVTMLDTSSDRPDRHRRAVEARPSPAR